MRACVVLLPQKVALSARSLRKGLEDFPQLGAPTWGGTKKGVSAVSFGTLSLTCALLPAPVPAGEADEATEASLSGLEGAWTLPAHQAHLVVVEHGRTKPKVAELTRFTRAVAAIARATGAVGVFWPAGHATHHPEFFIDIAKSELPLPAWVGVSVARRGRRVELLSLGMAQLALPDLLLDAPAADGATLGFFYELLAYVARRGRRLAEGDTVGRDEAEALPVRYGPSPLLTGEEVWQVSVPARPKRRAPRRPAR